MYDVLHLAERSVKRDGITDRHYLTRVGLQSINAVAAKSRKNPFQALVTKFTVNVHNTDDVKVDYHLAPDRVALHDVHANLAYLFRKTTAADAENFAGKSMRDIVTRAQDLRMSLSNSVSIVQGDNIRGAKLQRLLKLGSQYLKILDLFFITNAIAVGDDQMVDALFREVFPGVTSDLEKAQRVETLLAIAHMIPASVLGDAVTINNVLMGADTAFADVDDQLLHYVTAINFIAG